MTVADLTEAELIARIQACLAPPPDWLVVGIGDDAAVVEPERNRLEVLSMDALVEGVHFDRRFTPPDAIGHRALAVNLSDLAAMGAEPRLALLSLALPADLACAEFDAMIGGLAALAASHRLHVIGGNLTRSSGPLVVDMMVSGTVKRRQALRRRGARPGDLVYVTGSIGAAAAGLQMLKKATTEGTDTNGGSFTKELPCSPSSSVSSVVASCVRRYLYPEPRVRTGLLLARNRAASACVDLSDGLADGVHQIGAASGVGIVVDAEALPIDADALRFFEARGGDAAVQAVGGGDDYELVFTTRPQWAGRLKAATHDRDVPLTKIGVCTEGPDVMLSRGASKTPMPSGFSHFR